MPNQFETNVQMDNESNLQQDVRPPKMFAVIIHNDDYTTMDFVVDILIKVFHKNSVEASTIMMQVHKEGQGVVGVYTYDIAITKKTIADQMSSAKGFPLLLTVDEVME